MDAMNRAALVLIATGLLGVDARAWDDDLAPSWRGYVKGYAFEQAVEPYDLERVGTRLQLALSGGSGEPASYYAALDFEIDSSLLPGGDLLARDLGFEIYPVEIYANLSLGDVELRLGKQFIFWGRASWVNPTDVVSAWDYANIASEIEDYRVAPVAARLSWYVVNELMLDLVWVPIFQPHRIPIEVPTEMGPLPVVEQAPLLPGQSPLDGEFGLRLSHSVSAWTLDLALAAYLGYDKQPRFDVAPLFEDVVMGPPGTPPVSIPTSMSWTQRHERLWMLGADFAKTLGPFVLKGEGAIKSFNPLENTAQERSHNRAEGVLGLDYVWSEDLNLGLQYVALARLGWDREEQIALYKNRMGSGPDFMARAVEHQVSGRLNVNILPEVGGQVLALYSVSYIDFMVLGFIWWDIADALKLSVGGLAFGGQDDRTPFGRQADFSRLFFELKYSF